MSLPTANLFDLDLLSLKHVVEGLGEPGYRSGQIWDWMYKKFSGSFDEMSNLPASLREKLKDQITHNQLELMEAKEGPDRWSKKYLWGKNGQPLCESVILKYAYGLTACVSTQVGCPVGCGFCASGVTFQRSLSRGEILEEFIGMCKDQGQRVGRLVFMGTGEPFLNYGEVMGAIQTLADPLGYGLSRRKITVSTVGIPEAIKRFAKDSQGVRLALSLHAATNSIRDQIIPYNKRFPVEEIIASLKDYAETTGQRVTVEYMLLGGLNDSLGEAHRLADLVSGIDLLVNLIPWNEVPGFAFERPEPKKVMAFKDRLEKMGVKVTVRRSLGGSIDGACGQLGQKLGR